MDKTKETGQVFTPAYLVCDILDTAGYVGKACLQKHIIDNSCGNGAFLCEVVRRYCKAFFDARSGRADYLDKPSGRADYFDERSGRADSLRRSSDTTTLKEELRTYIHGIEIDVEAHGECLQNLKLVAAEFGIENIDWDILYDDTINVCKYDGKMDFVVGNPPYVRVHNLQDTYTAVRKFHFADGGMTDLYLVFFEIGLRMLANGGKLCYITPSSWLNSLAGKHLRDYIRKERNLLRLIDLEHYQAFNATTYTLISLFQKGERTDSFLYGRYLGEERVIKYVEAIYFEDAFIAGEIYLADAATLERLRNILLYGGTSYVSVKNGFATLADKVFIRQDFPFKEFVIPTIKASTGKWYKAFYPYDKSGKPLSKETLDAIPAIHEYLNDSKTTLLKGRKEDVFPEWYLYGRTQALLDVYKNKYAINTCIRDVKSIKLNHVPEGHGVYSGLYILTEIPFDDIQKLLVSDNFIRYVSLLKKYKSGGYYTFNSKELEHYLNYNLAKFYHNDTQQRDLFTGDF
ncbi:MAG: N-6 DNA methylase [Alloprevotella sp.]|nr:N-6 DNA methylase [Prevotella sp.]MBR1712709.1 N-6 DNA methylase [Alloprevotella sp.]